MSNFWLGRYTSIVKASVNPHIVALIIYQFQNNEVITTKGW